MYCTWSHGVTCRDTPSGNLKSIRYTNHVQNNWPTGGVCTGHLWAAVGPQHPLAHSQGNMFMGLEKVTQLTLKSQPQAAFLGLSSGSLVMCASELSVEWPNVIQ